MPLGLPRNLGWCSGHYIEVYRPELVIAAIRDITNDARKEATFQPSAESLYK